jgi:hypothetical protein
MKKIICSVCGEEFKIDLKTYNYLKNNNFVHVCDDCEDFLMEI